MKTDNPNYIWKNGVYKPLQFANCGAFAPKATHSTTERVAHLEYHQTTIWSDSHQYWASMGIFQ